MEESLLSPKRLSRARILHLNGRVALPRHFLNSFQGLESTPPTLRRKQFEDQSRGTTHEEEIKDENFAEHLLEQIKDFFSGLRGRIGGGK